MIYGYCVTNLDNYNCLITVFVAVPNIGDKVQVYYKGNNSTLKVCGITHYTEQNGTVPKIKVELHN